MRKVKFSLEYRDSIEKGLFKVVTFEGEPVNIISFDGPNRVFPIVGWINDETFVRMWTNWGGLNSDKKVTTPCDLYIITEDPGFSPFEAALNDFYYRCQTRILMAKDIKKEATKLIKLIGKEGWKPDDEQIDCLAKMMGYYKAHCGDDSILPRVEKLHAELVKLIR